MPGAPGVALLLRTGAGRPERHRTRKGGLAPERSGAPVVFGEDSTVRAPVSYLYGGGETLPHGPFILKDMKCGDRKRRRSRK